MVGIEAPLVSKALLGRNGTAAAGSRPLMGDVRGLWTHGHHTTTDADNRHWKRQRAKNECTCGLRQALMGALLLELEARMAKLAQDQPAQAPWSEPKSCFQDPLRWQYTRWNQEKQIHEPTTAAPLSHEKALTALRELEVGLMVYNLLRLIMFCYSKGLGLKFRV